MMQKYSKRNQMMDPFGEDDFFQSSIGGMMSSFDPFGGMNGGFHQMERQMNQRMNQMNQMMNMNFDNSNPGGGYSISKTYVSSTKMGPDGRQITEKYFDNNVVQKGRDGKTISERQQGYKNDGNNYKQIAQERMLDNQGRKFVQERIGNGPTNTTNYYHNIEESEKDQFDQRWNNHCEKVDFHKGIQKYLGNDSRQYQQIQNEAYQPNYNAQRNQQQRNQPTMNDALKGDFIPSNFKSQDQPVRIKKNTKDTGIPKNGLPMPEYTMQKPATKKITRK